MRMCVKNERDQGDSEILAARRLVAEPWSLRASVEVGLGCSSIATKVQECDESIASHVCPCCRSHCAGRDYIKSNVNWPNG